MTRYPCCEHCTHEEPWTWHYTECGHELVCQNTDVT
jgi:hypothetical protein